MIGRSILGGILTLTALMVVLGGCAGPSGPSFSDQAPPEGQAIVYVFRPARMGASLTDFKLWAGGRHYASLENGSFAPFYTEPGPVVLKATAKANMLNFGPGLLLMKTKELPLSVSPGETYFVNLDVGGFGFPKLNQVSRTEGIAQLQALRQTGSR